MGHPQTREPRRCRLPESFFYGGGEGKNGIDAGNPEKFHNPVAGADDGDSVSFALTLDVVVDELAHASGVHVVDVGEVKDGERSFFLAELGLEVQEIAEDERSVEFEDARAGLRRGGDFDLQGSTIHSA